jgi:hypoxanthine phosphoribosyltransferase
MADIHPHVEKILISEEQIHTRLVELGAQIAKDYKDAKDVVLVAILKGSFIFVADLVREIHIPTRIEFMAVSSYGNETSSSGAVKIVMDLRTDIENKHVIIVEDIIDTGLTMKFLLNLLSSRKPASLQVCSLLRKEGTQKVELDLKYIGFDIPKDAFVVGYGLDYAETLRNLKYVGILKEEVYRKK